jgi:beta-galactosidase
MIRQQYNHASIAVWSLGNETTFMHKVCREPWHDNLTPLFRELHSLAKQEDPSRATTYADFTATVTPPVNGSYIELGGITDVWARNEYPLWYGGAPTGDVLDALRKRYPAQPIGVSEYGAGAAITHHTDNVYGGPPEIQNTGQPVVYQPEEYAAYAHEQTYATYVSRKYLWATYAWNMFDFATDLRNEGDVRGVNTKGLVTFDRQTRKDPFWFYKANWSSEPVVYITGRRYVDRAYPVADVKVYCNAETIELSVNGVVIGKLRQEECVLKACLFRQVTLAPGANNLVATGHRGGTAITDMIEWRLNTTGINIAAGQIATGFRSASGELFGSDNFFIGGFGIWLEPKDFNMQYDRTPVRGTQSSDLFKNFRIGTFAYDIPLADGEYLVTLSFIEPYATTQIGQRVFNVAANAEMKIQNLDVLQSAGGYRTVVTKSFNATVSAGALKLDFAPTIGEAVVSNIMIKSAETATGSLPAPVRQ